jgi:hypothetical protein
MSGCAKKKSDRMAALRVTFSCYRCGGALRGGADGRDDPPPLDGMRVEG